MVVELSGRGLHPLALCCAHVLPEWGQVAKCNCLERVRASTPTVGEACLILGGDMNFPGVGEGRMDVRTGRVTMSDDNISSFFDGRFEELNEVIGDRPTRRGTCDGEVTTVSRIDRLFVSMLPSELVERNSCLYVLGELVEEDGMSDHVPILLSIGRARVGVGGAGSVLGWVASLPSSPDLVREQYERIESCRGGNGPKDHLGREGPEDLRAGGGPEDSHAGRGPEDPFDILLDYKIAMFRAASLIIFRSTAEECTSPDSKLFWVSVARDAVRARAEKKLRGAVGRLPDLLEYFDCDSCVVFDPSGLHRYTCDLVRQDIDRQLDELERSGFEGEEKTQKRSKLHSRLASWSAKGSQVVGVTVLRSDGAVGSQAFEALKDHWEPIFNGGEGDSKAREELRDCCSVP